MPEHQPAAARQYPGLVRSVHTIELRPARPIAAAMFGVAAVWPLLPAHPPGLCLLRNTTGIPCPLCGMTRAVVAAVHWDLAASLRFNPAGIPLVIAALALLLAWRVQRIRVPSVVLPTILGVLWVYNVALNPTFA